ncbi:MAG: DUF1841 family protein [Betaproteobacteria bacterium]|nr:DUF1841 family protein [Betaproteobacteria bacterium]
MFNPSREQARAFFIEAWRKRCARLPLTPLETIAADLAEIHPEYHPLLQQGDAALAREWTPEQGETNPFLHLSLHLAIEEQLSIDQPPGLRTAFANLLAQHGERHAVLHVILECLAETIWQAQRNQSAPDGAAYLECIKRR